MERRTFLRLGLGTAALVMGAPALGGDRAAAAPAPGPFGHGVASGDPLADRVMLWTRITPSADAAPGSGLGAPTLVDWEVATDAEFTRVVAAGQVTTDPASDHTVKLDLVGLTPSTDHWYRFRALGATSPAGRTRTAPASGSSVDQLRFGIVSCSNWQHGYFSAYRHLADRDDLDAILHLGDYLYEYEVGGYGPLPGLDRAHEPAVEMTELVHYRQRHAQYKTDPDLQRLHHRYAFITTIDDHEVADNSWSDGAQEHDPGEGDYLQRRAAALQAYFEWMPIRVTGGATEPTRIYRSLPFGGLVDLVFLDERTYRSDQPAGLSDDLFVTSGEPAEAGRTMLGAAQLTFLSDSLHSSQATWKVLGNGVMFAPLVIADPPNELVALLPAIPPVEVGNPVVLNGDQWDGYQIEQAQLSALFGEVGGVVILTGDIHSSWAAEIPADAGTYLPAVGGPTTAVEFVVPAVTSNSFSASIEGASGLPNASELSAALPTLVTTAGPWFKYLDPDRHGFGVFEVTPAHVQFDWYHISDRADPAATAAFTIAYESTAGSNRLVQAAQLGPRPPVGAGTGTTTSTTAAPGGTAAGRGTLPATGGLDGAALGIGTAAAATALAVAVVARRAGEES